MVLPDRVAREACADGEAELKTYLGANIEDDLTPSPSPSTGDVEDVFDVQKAWEYARLKCMIYSTIGDVEEEYVNFILGPEHALPPASEPTGPNDITPAAAIFLTAALELVGENLLLTAIRAARNRVRSANNLQFMGAEGGGVQFFIEEQDVAKGATSSDEKAKRLWADFVEDSHNAIPTVTSSVVRKEPEVVPLRPAGLSPIFEEAGTFEGVGVGVGVGALPSPPISAHSSGSLGQQKQFVGQQTLQVPGIQLAPPTPGSEEGPLTQSQGQLAGGRGTGLGFDFGGFRDALGGCEASAGGMRESGMFEPIRDSIYRGPVEGSVDAAFTEMENDLRGQQAVVTDEHMEEEVFVSTSNDLVEGEPVTPVMQTGPFVHQHDSDYVPYRKSSIVVSDADLESEGERLRQHSFASLVGSDERRPSAIDSEMTESDVEDVQVFTAHVASIAKAEVTLSPSGARTVSSHRSSDNDLREHHRGHGFVQDSPTIVRTMSRSRDTVDRPLSPTLSERSWKSPTKSIKMLLKRSPELNGEEWGADMRRSGSSSSLGRKSVLEVDETPEQAAKRLEFEALLAADETKKITLNIGELKKIETQKLSTSPRQIPRSPLAVAEEDDDDPFVDSLRKVRAAPTENLAKFIRSTGPDGEVISHEVVVTSPIISSPGTPRSVPLIAPPTVVNPIPSPALQSLSPNRTAPKRSIAEIRAAAGLAPREPTVQKRELTYDLADFLRSTDPTNLKPADLAGPSKTSPAKKQVSFTHDTATLASASAETDSLSSVPTFGSNSFYQAKRISEDAKTTSSSVATTPILAQSTGNPNSPSLKSTKSMSQSVHGSPASTSSKRFANKSRMPQNRNMVPRAPTKDLEEDENDSAMDSDEELFGEYSRKPRKLASKDESLADFLKEMPLPSSSSRALPTPVAEPVKKSKGLFGSRRGKNDSPNKSKSQPLVSPSAEVMLGRFK
ncbi:hypothetical protein SAICODRAFT_29164 [Saitoella complicata NRRL Y-17804]|nr:uncharacterized protein SAICODRAFT_29164 [Saitoella complicata NRRL Y-17804]ODQ54944.1 hypothetical protein SAICODRAFT_29164 [Saitoella complicata NRRL Y-17804]